MTHNPTTPHISSARRGHRSPFLLAFCLLAFCLLASCLAALLLAPIAQANRAVIGSIETLPGRESGAPAPSGLAVNAGGAGGVSPGDLYVANTPNYNIEEFSAAGAFVRSFGYDVVAAGPDNTGANEKQTVTVDPASSALWLTAVTGSGFGDLTPSSTLLTKVSTTVGAFHVGDGISGCGIFPGTKIVAVGAESLTLSAATNSFFCPPHRKLTTFKTTTAIPYGPATGAAEVEAALTAAVGAGNVAVGGPGGGPYTVEFKGALAHNDVPPMGAVSSPQTVTLQNATGGTFTLTFQTQTTSSIAFNATAAEVKSALAALGSVGAGNVEVTGSSGGPWRVTFTGALAGSQQPTMSFQEVNASFSGSLQPAVSVDGSKLTGTSPSATAATPSDTVVTVIPGGGFEVCDRLANPSDVCKSGSGSSAAGAMSPLGVAVDQATGNLYVLDAGLLVGGLRNNRVDVYSAKGSFQGAFGWGVILPGGAEGTGTLEAGSTEVKSVQTSKKAFLAGQTITATGIAPATKIASVGPNGLTLSQAATASGTGVALSVAENVGKAPQNENQSVTVPAAATSGNFKLTFTAPAPQTLANPQTTANIPFNASLAEVQSALEALTNIGAGNVVVALKPGGDAGGGAKPGGPWTVEFTGARLGDTNLAQMSPAAGSPNLSSGAAGVTTVAEGAGGPGLEFCTPATGCQAGTAGGGSGQIGGRSEGGEPAVDPASGDLYLPDGGSLGNARVQVLRPTLVAGAVTGASFVKSIGWDVVASGQDQSSEVQKVIVRATAGKFKLTFGAATTGELDFNVPAAGGVGPTASLENALNTLGSISGAGLTVKVKGGPGDRDGTTPYFVTFLSSPAKGADVAQISATAAGLTGGLPASKAEVETYNDGGAGLEVCAVSRADVCKKGSEGAHMGQFQPGPESLAVDSTGALYASNPSTNKCAVDGGVGAQYPCRLFKFTFPAPGEVEAAEFAPAQLTFSKGEQGQLVGVTDVAVDPTNDNVVVAKKQGPESYRFLEFDPGGELLGGAPGAEGTLGVGSNIIADGLAIGAGERLYFSNPLGRVDMLGPPPPPAVEIKPPTSVGATTATFHGVVTPAVGLGGERFPTTYHFEYSLDAGANWGRFPATEVALGDGSGVGDPNGCPTANPPSCNVSQNATGLQPNIDYLVRIVASNGSAATSGSEALTTEPAPPAISGTVATEVAQTSARLSALVNPNNDATTYHFEWGTGAGYPNRAPALPDPSAGAGGEAVRVSAPIAGLKGAATYHFRVVATNSGGSSEGPDQAFSTLDGFGLPDGRAPEQVSPNDKRPTGSVQQFSSNQIIFQSAADGDSVLYPLLNGLPDSTAGGSLEYLAARGAAGWRSTQLTPPSLLPALAGNDQTGRVLYASPDLSCQVVESFEPLTEDVPVADLERGVKNLYLYRRSPDGSHTYTLLTAPVPPNEAGGNVYHVDWASDQCAHVLFTTAYRLLPGAAGSGGEETLYEWAAGTLRIAGVRPDGSVPSGSGSARAGAGGNATTVNSISEDGARVFFTAHSNQGANHDLDAVFMRAGGVSVDVSKSQTATENNGASTYEMASADGTHVFFTARYGLAPGASSSGASSCVSAGAGCDLYDYTTATGALTDLSADANSADAGGAGVAGVLDVSENGSYVYFAARGQLLPGEGPSEVQNLSKGTYSVYLAHPGGLKYVGSIAANDTINNIRGGNLAHTAFSWVADATPDGTHLLFVSQANVTGYQSGGAPEAYLYSASTGDVVCVSCRPDGEPSVGGPSSEPLAKLSPVGPWVTVGRPRSISDDGRRVFFTSPDVLAAGAREGAHNVYEWQEGQVYLLAAGESAKGDLSRYADSSPNGDDVFLATKSKLVPQDFDNTLDLYDLRAPHVPGEEVGPQPGAEVEVPCDPAADQCQGEPKPPPGEGAASSSEGAGPGNPPVPAPRCRKGFLRRHGKCVKKPRRAKRHHKRASHNPRRAAR